MSDQNKIRDKSRDAKYFTINPRIVKYYSRTPYDYSLWDTIKEVAGDSSECFLSTEDLAALSGMSIGKVVDCRNYWISLGFLEGEVRKDPGYPQPVWHLSIPDLWGKNIEWAESHLSIKSRIEFKKTLHDMKPSPHEGGTSSGEGGYSPHEAKNKEKNKEKVEQDDFSKTLEQDRQRIVESEDKRGDPIEGWMNALRMQPGVKKSTRLEEIHELFCAILDTRVSFNKWESFYRFVDEQEQTKGRHLHVFMRYLFEDDNFSMKFWNPNKMIEAYPEAFPANNPNNVPVEIDPETGFAPFDFGNITT